jgi:relA/spoT domain protein
MQLNINPESGLNRSVVRVPDLANVPDGMLDYARQFQQSMMMYSCAIREVKTKLEVLNDELSIRNKRNPIEMIKSRVKKPESIIEKLTRRGLSLDIDSMMTNLNDIAGVRVICSFVDDIYDIATMLINQDDVKIIEIKDYIKNPKPNGYRSYHMIIEIPVFFSDKKQFMRVEVQIRTIAMDFWASVEHKIKYKKEVEGAEEIIKELKECADIISSTDDRMQNIRKRLEGDK